MSIKVKNILKSVIPVVSAASIGSIFMIFKSIDYKTINKPLFAPSGFIFPIVWSILYISIGISTYLYLKKADLNNEDTSKTMVIYYIDMFVNAFWTFFFFTLGAFFFAIIWLVLLIVVALSRFIQYYKVDKLSAFLNIPYLIWLCIAIYLNVGTFLLN